MVSLKRKLAAGSAAVVVVAGAVAGAGIASSGHGQSLQPVRHLQLKSTTEAGFLRAAAGYLGTNVATLRREEKSGRTLADIANDTQGTSAKELATRLASAALGIAEYGANRALSNKQSRTLHSLLLRRVTGFLNDTCPLGLAGVAADLGGCPGMAKRLHVAKTQRSGSAQHAPRQTRALNG